MQVYGKFFNDFFLNTQKYHHTLIFWIVVNLDLNITLNKSLQINQFILK